MNSIDLWLMGAGGASLRECVPGAPGGSAVEPPLVLLWAGWRAGSGGSGWAPRGGAGGVTRDARGREGEPPSGWVLGEPVCFGCMTSAVVGSEALEGFRASAPQGEKPVQDGCAAWRAARGFSSVLEQRTGSKNTSGSARPPGGRLLGPRGGSPGTSCFALLGATGQQRWLQRLCAQHHAYPLHLCEAVSLPRALLSWATAGEEGVHPARVALHHFGEFVASLSPWL